MLFQATFAVASSGCLGDGIEPSQGPIHHRKINIHSCFNQRGADHNDGIIFVFESFFHLGYGACPMLGAHIGGKVNGLFLRQQPGQTAGILLPVHNTENRPAFLFDCFGEFRQLNRLQIIPMQHDFRPL